MPRIKPEPLKKFYNEDSNLLEIGIDEAGRGPLFGRVYTAAVILPKDTEFDFDKKSIPHKHKSGGEGAARAGGGVVNKNILLILYRRKNNNVLQRVHSIVEEMKKEKRREKRREEKKEEEEKKDILFSSSFLY